MKKTFIIPMAFVVASSVSIGTGLLVNKLITTNDSHTESVMMSDPKIVETAAASPTDMKMTTTVDSDTAITVDTTFVDGTDNTAASSSYTATNTTDTTADNVTIIGNPTTGTDTVTFTGLTPGAQYSIFGIITDTAEGTLYNTVIAATTTTSPTNVVTTTEVTDTAITVDTIFTDGTDNTATSSLYTIEAITADASIGTNDGIGTIGTGTDTVTFTGLTPGAQYSITGTIKTNNTPAGDITIDVPSVYTKVDSPTHAVTTTSATDTTITVDTTFVDGTDNTAASSSYTVTNTTDTTADNVTIIGNPTTGTDTVTFTGLTPGAQYSITGTIKTNNTPAGDITIDVPSVTTMTTIATAMDIVLGEVTETEITITNSWIDGFNPALTSSYTITEFIEEPVATADPETPGPQTIIGNTLTTPGTESIEIKFIDLTANTDYTITGTLTFGAGNESLVVKSSKFTTADSGLSDGAIAGIVIGSLAGVTLIGGGSYWLIKHKG